MKILNKFPLIFGFLFYFLPGICFSQTSKTEPTCGQGCIEGFIIQISEDELIIDLGRSHSLPNKAEVQVFRRLLVTHPVTGEQLVDRFPMGEVVLDEVGEILSIARNRESLNRAPSVGDFVVYTPEFHQLLDPVDEEPVLENPQFETKLALPEPDPAITAATDAFEETLGQSLDTRMTVWVNYLLKHPDSPYKDQITTELNWLYEQRTALTTKETTVKNKSAKLNYELSVPKVVYSNEPLIIGIAVDKPETVQVMRALLRRKKEPTYETLEMEQVGDFNWQIRVPEELSQVGELEFFAEALKTDNTLSLLVGDARRPNRIIIREPKQDKVEHGNRSRANTKFEYVDFQRGDVTDHYVSFEADFRYITDVFLLRAVSVGAGIFHGEGASLENLKAGSLLQTQDIGYGFIELEFEFFPYMALAWRFSAGNRDHSEEDSMGRYFGNTARIRIGKENDTRLELGGTLSDDIGNEVWTKFYMEVIENIPITVGVIVTNFPVGEAVGVRFSLGVGYRFSDWFALSAHTGMNFRTSNDFGPTVGLGTTLNW